MPLRREEPVLGSGQVDEAPGNATIPDGSQGPVRRGRSGGARIRMSILLGVLAGVVVVAGSLARTSSAWSVTVPGPAFLIVVEDIGNQSGEYRFTTVQIDQLTWGEYVWNSMIGGPQMVRRVIVDVDRDAFAEMETAKLAAWEVASAFTSSNECDGAIVDTVTAGLPASRAGIAVGDRIVSVGDVTLTCASGVAKEFQRHGGKMVRVTVDGDNGPRIVTVTAEKRDGRWVAGMTLQSAGLSSPPAVSTSGVGGGSAGLLLTLAYLDALEDGDLTAGRTVSGTGTMSLSGHVGAVGGLPYKVRGAEQAGVDVFFVPAELAASVPDTKMTVVPVDTVDDAVRWLCDNGGTAPVCATAGN
jgi:Lon-like protease